MTITIRSTREGFWRCGIKHSLEARDYPNDAFSPDDLERLMAEPMLVVIVTQGADEAKVFDPKDVLDPFKMTLAELKKLAKEMGLAYEKTVKQAELAQMINDELARCHKQEMDALDKAAAANQPAGEAETTADGGADDEGADDAGKIEDSGEPPTE